MQAELLAEFRPTEVGAAFSLSEFRLKSG
jgi:hypothetical protein